MWWFLIIKLYIYYCFRKLSRECCVSCQTNTRINETHRIYNRYGKILRRAVSAENIVLNICPSNFGGGGERGWITSTNPLHPPVRVLRSIAVSILNLEWNYTSDITWFWLKHRSNSKMLVFKRIYDYHWIHPKQEISLFFIFFVCNIH